MHGSLTFSNPNATFQKDHPYIIWNAIGVNTPRMGYASDQKDGTFLIASLKGTTYQTGLAIGGGSGNLLWKGERVLTASDMYVLPTASCTVKGGVKPAYSSTKAATLTTAAASNTTTPTIAAKTTTSGRYYAVESDINGVLFVNVPWSNTNTKVTSVGNHYTPSADDSSALSADASSTTSASWASTSLVTGVNLQRDAAGHVVGITVDSIRMPRNPNTHAVSSVNGKTGAVTLTYSDVGAASSSHGTHVTASTVKSALGIGTGTTKFLREDGSWATPAYYTLSKAKVEAVLTGAITSHTHSYLPLSGGTLTGALTGTTATFTSVKGAVWNDYAEYRSGASTEPGKVVKECPDGILRITESRLEPGCEIISDTFGFAIGETDECKTPVATSGRVLAYPFEDKDTFELGQAVCSGPNGTVSKMTREEVMMYPERIIGTVSEIPQYETWGTGNVAVNERIWIRVR